MKTLLYLDDKRNPFLELSDKINEEYRTIWVRNYDEFQAILEDIGVPDLVSFDHDLHPEHYTPEYFWNDYAASKKYQEYVREKYVNPTGAVCADFLQLYCENNGHYLPSYIIHSANPVGAEWIREVLPIELEVYYSSL